jgi:hypothetical protein
MDLNTMGQSPSRSPQLSPLYRSNAMSISGHNEFPFPALQADMGPPLPVAVTNDNTETGSITMQMMRDSGYGADMRPHLSDAEKSFNKEAGSDMIFSDEECAALVNADDRGVDADTINEFIVSDEVAALAAATKAAFMRRTRNPGSVHLRQRSSTPTLRDSDRGSAAGNAAHFTHSRSTSFSKMLISPTSPLATESYSSLADNEEGAPAVYDMEKELPKTPHSPTVREPIFESDTKTIITTFSNEQMSAQICVSPLEAFPVGASIDLAGFDSYSGERRQAMKRLLFHLRDLWDLGVGLQITNDDAVHVRMLETQSNTKIPEELIGNRPVSLDVNGCK